MRKTYPDYEDDNDFYSTLLLVFKALHKSDKRYYLDIAPLTSLDKAGRLRYRYEQAVNGREMTPVQVDQLIHTINYAKEMADV